MLALMSCTTEWDVLQCGVTLSPSGENFPKSTPGRYLLIPVLGGDGDRTFCLHRVPVRPERADRVKEHWQQEFVSLADSGIICTPLAWQRGSEGTEGSGHLDRSLQPLQAGSWPSFTSSRSAC